LPSLTLAWVWVGGVQKRGGTGQAFERVRQSRGLTGGRGELLVGACEGSKEFRVQKALHEFALWRVPTESRFGED